MRVARIFDAIFRECVVGKYGGRVPSRTAQVQEILGRSVVYRSIWEWRTDRYPLPDWAAFKLAERLQSSGEAALAMAAELRRYGEVKAATPRKARGWQLTQARLEKRSGRRSVSNGEVAKESPPD